MIMKLKLTDCKAEKKYQNTQKPKNLHLGIENLAPSKKNEIMRSRSKVKKNQDLWLRNMRGVNRKIIINFFYWEKNGAKVSLC